MTGGPSRGPDSSYAIFNTDVDTVRISGTPRSCQDDHAEVEGLSLQERRHVEHVECGEIAADRVAAELRAQIVTEEPGALAHDVVEDEEAVDLGKKCHFVGAHGKHAAIGREEGKKRGFDKRVRTVGEPGSVAGAARHA